MRKLKDFRTSGSSSYDKLESLAQAVQQATSSLRHVQSEAVLDTDFSLVNCFAAKLPPIHLDKWYEAVARAGGEVTWPRFVARLQEARATARVARTAEM